MIVSSKSVNSKKSESPDPRPELVALRSDSGIGPEDLMHRFGMSRETSELLYDHTREDLPISDAAAVALYKFAVGTRLRARLRLALVIIYY